MIQDAQNQFSNAQAVTAAAASSNILDLGIARNLGVGENLFLIVDVIVAMTDTNSNSALRVDVETCSSSAFGTNAVAQTFTIPALSAIGYQAVQRIQPGAVNERYVRLKYTPTTDNLTAGSFSSVFVHDADLYTSYKKGYTIS